MSDSNRPDRTMAPEAEKAVLGCILLAPELFSEVAEIVDDSDFFDLRCATVFRAMRRRAGRPDLTTVLTELEQSGTLAAAGGKAFLMELMEATPTGVHAMTYAADVRDAGARRRTIKLAADLAAEARTSRDPMSEIVERFGDRLLAVAENPGAKDVVAVGDLLRDVVEQIGASHNAPGGVTGVDTGFSGLNWHTCGWQRGTLNVIAARPSVGKTTLAMNVALSAARSGAVVLFVTAEMSAREIVRNLLCNMGTVSSSRIRGGRLTAVEWERLTVAGEEAQHLKFFLDDGVSPTAARISRRAKSLKAAHGRLDLIVVDYLQLMHAPDGATREQEVSGVSRALKQLARELDCPVIALAQLNRGSTQRVDKRPVPSDLRDSGAIEQDADVLILLHEVNPRDDGAAAIRDIEAHVAKNRNGARGLVHLQLDGAHFKFSEPSP